MVYIKILNEIYPSPVTNFLMIFHDLTLYHENIVYTLNGLVSTSKKCFSESTYTKGFSILGGMKRSLPLPAKNLLILPT